MQTNWEYELDGLLAILKGGIWYAIQYRGITRREIARRANVHITTLHALLREDKTTNPTIGTLCALARAISEVNSDVI